MHNVQSVVIQGSRLFILLKVIFVVVEPQLCSLSLLVNSGPSTHSLDGDFDDSSFH